MAHCHSKARQLASESLRNGLKRSGISGTMQRSTCPGGHRTPSPQLEDAFQCENIMVGIPRHGNSGCGSVRFRITYGICPMMLCQLTLMASAPFAEKTPGERLGSHRTAAGATVRVPDWNPCEEVDSPKACASNLRMRRRKVCCPQAGCEALPKVFGTGVEVINLRPCAQYFQAREVHAAVTENTTNPEDMTFQ